MGVAALVAVAVVDHYLIAVAGELEFRLLHHAVAGGEDRVAPLGREILTGMEGGGAVHRVRAEPERAGHRELPVVRDDGRNCRHAGHHVAGFACDEPHFVQRLALQVGAAGKRIHPQHHLLEGAGGAGPFFGRIALSIHAEFLQFGRHLGKAVDGPVDFIVPLLYALQRLFALVQAAVEHFGAGLPQGIAAAQYGRLREFEAEDRSVQPEIQIHQRQSPCDQQEYPQRLEGRGLVAGLVF